MVSLLGIVVFLGIVFVLLLVKCNINWCIVGGVFVI